jgi:RpiR family carbohydrate utilization transcriptional regulator
MDTKNKEITSDCPYKGLGTLFKVESIFKSLAKTEQRVAKYILANPKDVIYLPVTELAEKTRSSEATVVRLCRKAGFKGYQDLKLELAQEIVSPLESIHEEIKLDDDTQTIVSKVFQGINDTLQYTLKVLNFDQLHKVIDLISNAKLVDVYGSGNSAAVAMDLHHKLTRIGINSRVSWDGHLQMIYSATLKPGDLVFGVSHSGSSRNIVDSLKQAKSNGAVTISITNYGHSPLSKIVDYPLYTASDETKFRVVGLASRIAQLAIIDSIHALLTLHNIEKNLSTTRKVLKALEVMKY